jgi:hypothetical protein
MASEPSAIAADGDNNLTVATRTGFVRLNTTSGDVPDLCPAPYDTRITRFNDGRVDPAGRFWVGTMYEPRDKPAAEMHVLECDRLRLAWSGGMTNSNGLAWGLGGTTTSHRIDRYGFDAATGQVANRRNLVTFSLDKSAADYGGRPDGATVNSEGNYWIAMFEGGRCPSCRRRANCCARFRCRCAARRRWPLAGPSWARCTSPAPATAEVPGKSRACRRPGACWRCGSMCQVSRRPNTFPDYFWPYRPCVPPSSCTEP